MPDNIYTGLVPPELWRHFANLNRLPRPSGHEDAARNYAIQIADARGLRSVVDHRGNLLIFVPKTEQAREDTEPVAIQCHLDMVCEAETGVVHDFAVDPIQPRREGDWILATGTTLGADNGIGVAAALSLITTPELQHGPLELIFTVEEETGLYGAAALDASMLRARRLINLDSEDPDGLTIGSAGGATVAIALDAPQEKVACQLVGRKLLISGLKGGHSGIQIHQRLGNAIKLLADLLTAAAFENVLFQIASLRGGTSDNAIPRQCEALLVMEPLSAGRFDNFVQEWQQKEFAAWVGDEPSIVLSAHPCSAPKSVWSRGFGQCVLQMLLDLPHGALRMSSAFPDSVETSANLASVRTNGQAIEVVVSVRSSAKEQLDALERRINTRAQKVGAAIDIRDRYPAWQPNLNSPLLNLAGNIFRRLRGKAPLVQVLHGGLECGLIVSKVPEMDAISFGPLIRFAHTPQECVDIPSVDATWRMLVALLKTLSQIGASGRDPSTQHAEVSTTT